MPGRPRKYDPSVAEHEYVTGEVSLRELAKKHNVSFSSMASFARREDWSGKRVAYKSALARRTYDVMAMDAANISAAIKDESVKVARATLAVYAEKLASRQVQISPKDAVEMIRTLAELLKEPGEVKRDERVILDGNTHTLNADLLRGVADAARGRLAADRVLDGVTAEEPARTRPN